MTQAFYTNNVYNLIISHVHADSSTVPLMLNQNLLVMLNGMFPVKKLYLQIFQRLREINVLVCTW